MSDVEPKISARSPEEARNYLWSQGILTWKLDENQKDLYKMYKKSKNKINVWNCCRGLGKSTLLCVIAIEECLKHPDSLVKYACASERDAKKIVSQVMKDILSDCPPEIKPKFIKHEGSYIFPNGSQLQLAGLNGGRAESLRGGSARLAVVDEAAFVNASEDSGLKYVVKSILLPAVTRKKELNGKIILASTPPKSAGHPYVYFLRRAEIQGCAITRTLYHVPRYTKDMIETIIEECGGENSTEFRREYLAEIITDEDSAVIPEFTTDLQTQIIRTWERPPYFTPYVGMDLGLKDLTAVIFAYHDFRNNRLVIEDEYTLNGRKFNTSTLAQAIKEKEDLVFINPVSGERVSTYKRVSDNNLIVIADLQQLHGLTFLPTRKDDKDAAINDFRMRLANGQIIINPKCENLIRHIRDATWAKNRKTYNRGADNGHYDLLDAIIYLVRNVDWGHNPYPNNYNAPSSTNYYYYRNNSVPSDLQTLAKAIMGLKK